MNQLDCKEQRELSPTRNYKGAEAADANHQTPPAGLARVHALHATQPCSTRRQPPAGSPYPPALPAKLIPCLQRFTCRLPVAVSGDKMVLHGLQRGGQPQLGRKGEQVLDFPAADAGEKVLASGRLRFGWKWWQVQNVKVSKDRISL